jgi:uncharacterized YigZ family protein
MAEYRTVAKEASEEFVERRSRFIGYAKPVKTEEEAVLFINAIKSKNWNATHNVYAYSIREGQIKRYSDDGEPQGTAGIPTLDVLLKSNVTDIAVVVTRYFGGILLGAGGLVRAYSHACSIALEQAEIITMRTCFIAEVVCDYNQYGRLAALIPENGGVMDHTDFTDLVTIRFHMSDENMPVFRQNLLDATCGKSSIEITGEKYFNIL